MGHCSLIMFSEILDVIVFKVQTFVVNKKLFYMFVCGGSFFQSIFRFRLTILCQISFSLTHPAFSECETICRCSRFTSVNILPHIEHSNRPFFVLSSPLPVVVAVENRNALAFNLLIALSPFRSKAACDALRTLQIPIAR